MKLKKKKKSFPSNLHRTSALSVLYRGVSIFLIRSFHSVGYGRTAKCGFGLIAHAIKFGKRVGQGLCSTEHTKQKFASSISLLSNFLFFPFFFLVVIERLGIEAILMGEMLE